MLDIDVSEDAEALADEQLTEVTDAPKTQPAANETDNVPSGEKDTTHTETDDGKVEDTKSGAETTEVKETRNQRRRRLAKERQEQLSAELTAAQKRIAVLEGRNDEAPKSEDFDSEAEYTAALAVYQMHRENDKRDREAAQSDIDKIHHDQAREWEARAEEMQTAARERYADFDEKLDVAISLTGGQPSPAIAEAIRTEDGADIAYYLGCNPEFTKSLTRMSDMQAAMEIGRISAGLNVEPAKPKTTAPEPIKPVRGKAAAARTLADIDDMDEYANRRASSL